MPGAEDAESRPKIGRRGQPLQDREPMPGAKDAESRPKKDWLDQPRAWFCCYVFELSLLPILPSK